MATVPSSVRRRLTLATLTALPLACVVGEGNAPSPDAADPFLADPYQLAGDAFTIEGDLGSFAHEMQLEVVGEDLYELTDDELMAIIVEDDPKLEARARRRAQATRRKEQAAGERIDR